jgi:sugar lactone lactonase YvrE
VKSKLKKLPFELNETTSLTTIKFGPMYYITSTVAGPSTALLYPNAAVSDPDGNLFIADTVNEAIKQVSQDGTVTVLAGSLDQTSGNTDGLGNDATFFGPTGITRDASGTLYVLDAINNRIRKILPDGTVVTLAGSTAGFQNGQGSSAQFNFLYATNP